MNQVLSCSFCGKSECDERGLLAGIADDSICFNCIEQSLFFPLNTNPTASCNFCGKRKAEVSKLMMGKKANICSGCVKSALNPHVLIRSGFIINPKSGFGSWLLNSKNRFIRKYIVGSKS
jgi:ATP-dependent protease Clp ATPase subunit